MINKAFNPQLVREIELYYKERSDKWSLSIKKGTTQKLFGIIKMYKFNEDYYCDGETCLSESSLKLRYKYLTIENREVFIKPHVSVTFLNGGCDNLYFDTDKEALEYFNNFFK